jgi:hypothetical protein
VFDGEALIGPGMKDARSGKPVVGQFRHPIPREAVLLAAAPERPTPIAHRVQVDGPKRAVDRAEALDRLFCLDQVAPVPSPSVVFDPICRSRWRWWRPQPGDQQ